jgi:beta-lactam-binding protein with PASTA domain
MKTLLRYSLLALVLMAVALLSALTAMRLAIHGREVAVPKLEGLSPAEAERVASEQGFTVEVERQFYSAQVPAGKIMTQTPAPGTQVRRGWRLRVGQSLGAPRVAVPDVVGQSQRAAEINIQRRGLQVGSVAVVELPGKTADAVIAQNPPANAGNLLSPSLGLLVAATPTPQAYVMPSFIGQPLGSATLAINDAGLHLGSVTNVAAPAGDTATPMPPSPGSFILSQNPAPGQKVVAGAVVTFEVNR